MKSRVVAINLSTAHYMKRTIELVVLFLLLLLFAFYVAGQPVVPRASTAQVNGQPAQPTSPKDRVTPTEELNASAPQQPIALKVVGTNLRDNQGATVGRVEDLVVDPASGRIEFLIVSAFYPTNSTKLMPIPWKAVSARSEQSAGAPGANQIFALNFPRTKLQRAPTFERYRWPDMAQSAWRQPIYQFYSAKEVAAEGGTGSETETGAGVGANTSSPPPSLPQNQKPPQ